MTYQPPCSDPTSNPDAWFISRDGKQYADDEFLTQDERDRIAKAVLRKTGESDFDHETRVDAAIRQAEATRKRKALAARRHAKEACHGCYFRTACLDRALTEGQAHGTWGGYFEEELREIRREISRRKRVRKGA